MNINELTAPHLEWLRKRGQDDTADVIERLMWNFNNLVAVENKQREELAAKDQRIEELEDGLAFANRELDRRTARIKLRNKELDRAEQYIEKLEEENQMLNERLGKFGLEIVKIGDSGHYVSAKVKQRIEELENQVYHLANYWEDDDD